MVVIFDAYRIDKVTGTATLHRGTKEYLESIRAVFIEKSAREVPDHHVDAKGEYLLRESDADRT